MDSENNSALSNGSIWPIEAEEMLLALWSQNVAKLGVNRTNFYTFSKMANKMDEMGYSFTAFEIRYKMQSLKKRYREERRRMSEGIDTDWQLYESIHNIVEMCNANKYTFTNIERDNVSTGDNNSQLNYPEEQYEDTNEEEYQNEESLDNADEAAATSPSKNKGSINNSESEYLKSINSNLLILVKKLTELSQQSQDMEIKRNASLKELLHIFKTPTNGERPAKKIKLSDHDELSSTGLANGEDSDYDAVVRDNREYDPLCNEVRMKSENDNEDYEHDDERGHAKQSLSAESNKMMLDKKLKEEYLKTKQMERDFMREKHKLQMEILNTELEAKRKKVMLKRQ